MKWITLRGKQVDVPTAKYMVDWEAKQGSKFSKGVLDWLRPYWGGDRVLAEWPVPGQGRMRFDFVNLSKHVIVETDGEFHETYSSHFHGSQSAFRMQMLRDQQKNDIARLNGFTMVRIMQKDLPLTKEWFLITYDVML